MGKYSLHVKFAELPIRIICQTKTDAFFLKEKYREYIDNISDLNSNYREVYLKIGYRSKVAIKNTTFYLYLSSLRKDFFTFNMNLRRVFIYLVNRNNGFVLHASSLVKDNFGYIFAGKAGKGKSTIRKLFPELISLGDDSAIIRKIGKSYFLFGSPFHQRTKTAYPNIKVHIKIVAMINKSLKNQLGILSFPDNLTSMTTNAFVSYIGNKEEEREQLIKTVFNFCQLNNIYDFKFRKERSILSVIDHNI
jgi:hypothetical protein